MLNAKCVVKVNMYGIRIVENVMQWPCQYNYVYISVPHANTNYCFACFK